MDYGSGLVLVLVVGVSLPGPGSFDLRSAKHVKRTARSGPGR